MTSTVVMKIMSLQSSFTSSENEISQFVIKNQDFVITNTITELAKKIGTSEASVNRFCKKIGYKGFNSFKISLAQSNFNSGITTTNEGNLSDANVIESMSNDYRQMILNTSAMMNEQDLTSSAQLIKEAKCIHIIALINTSFVANEFAFKLGLIGLNVKVHIDILDIHLCVPNLEENDLVIAIVPSLLSKDIYPTLINAKERSAKIILITSYDSAKFNDIIDIKLITPDKIIAKNSFSLSNSLMSLFVVDLIFEILLREDKTFRQKKLSSDSIVNTHQMIDTYLFDY